MFENPDYLSAGSAQGAKISKRNGLRGITIPVHPATSRYFGAPAPARPVAPGTQPKGWREAVNVRRPTLALAGLTLLVLVLSLPGALREAFDRGGLYLFSRAFLDDVPKRLTGPGRFRFVLQPLVAILLGIRSGVADARAGRTPYLLALVTDRRRAELAREGLATVVNLLLMGVLLDAIFQWVILGVSHPGAALVVGPVLIAAPYGVARALSNRVARRRARG